MMMMMMMMMMTKIVVIYNRNKIHIKKEINVYYALVYEMK